MTDERLGAALWAAVAALPRGSGIVFRHYHTPLAERRRLFAELQRVARRRGHLLIRAGEDRLGWREDGVHNARRRPASRLLTCAVHDVAERAAARRAGAELIFVSPIYPTRSHPGARALGVAAATALIRGASAPAIALGGMTPSRGARLMRLGFHGWAAIDAWTP